MDLEESTWAVLTLGIARFITSTDEKNAKLAPQRAGTGTEVSYEQLNRFAKRFNELVELLLLLCLHSGVPSGDG